LDRQVVLGPGIEGRLEGHYRVGVIFGAASEQINLVEYFRTVDQTIGDPAGIVRIPAIDIDGGIGRIRCHRGCNHRRADQDIFRAVVPECPDLISRRRPVIIQRTIDLGKISPDPQHPQM
jgi:hypothetical protein